MSDDVVTLISKSRRAHTIVLDHAAFRTKQHGFRVRSLQLSDRRVRHPTAGSLTLLPGASIEGLPPAIASLPQVKQLLSQREIAIESPRGDSKKTKTADVESPRGDSDSPQPDRERATLGRSRARVEKGT